MSFVRLQIDQGRIGELIREAEATPAKVRRAAVRALDKTAKQLRRGILRGLAADLGTPQKAMEPRIRYTRPNKKTLSAYVWIGLNPLQPEQLGRVREQRRPGGGVYGGKHFFPGAFIARVGGSERSWQRAGKDRLPLKRPELSINRLGELIINPLSDQAQTRLPVVLEQELNYSLRIET